MPLNRVALTALALSLCACQSVAVSPSEPRQSALSVTADDLPETSGLAASHRKPGFFWAVNDSGNSAVIHLLDGELQPRGAVPVTPKNRDWEDLASYQRDGQSWIIIAETGDNLRQYPTYFLYVFSEDTLLDGIGGEPVSPDHTVEFTYEDGAQNCEAIAVDHQSNRVLLVSKRRDYPTLYTLPLDLTTSGEALIAKQQTQLAAFPGRPVDSLVKTLTGINPDAVTAMDISTKQGIATLLTYRDVWAFKKTPDQTWTDAFAQTPQWLGSFSLQQAEALAHDSAKPRTIAVSEGAPVTAVVIETPTN